MGGNYRGISLISLVAKTYDLMIMNRIRPYLDFHLRKHQKGFRSGRTTTSQILALRRLIEGVKDRNLEPILIFIDFKKAFDTVHVTRTNSSNTKSVWYTGRVGDSYQYHV